LEEEMLLKELREKVYYYCTALPKYELGHGSQGNISALDPETGLIAIKPSAINYDVMKPEDICVVDKFGNHVEGKWKSTSETPMHTIFYRERPDVGAVIHTHAPYATVFGVINEPIPPILTEASTGIGGPVRVAAYQTPGTDALAQGALTEMGNDVCIILAHHGLLAVGLDLEKAFDTTLAVETSARLVILARSMGAKVNTIPQSEIDLLRKMYLEKYHPHSA
jgi:ribulose-5-phosphate 4-epimerase/fuculose-1-phosphate aldolase